MLDFLLYVYINLAFWLGFQSEVPNILAPESSKIFQLIMALNNLLLVLLFCSLTKSTLHMKQTDCKEK